MRTRRPTRRQKILISLAGLDPKVHLVLEETDEDITVIHRDAPTRKHARIIRKAGACCE